MIVRSDESLNLDIAVAALALAEELDFWLTRPREDQVPPAILARLRAYRAKCRHVPLAPGVKR